MGLPRVEKFKIGDRVRIVVGGRDTEAVGEVVKIGPSNNGYKVRFDDSYLADKPSFYVRETWVRPLNLRRI